MDFGYKEDTQNASSVSNNMRSSAGGIFSTSNSGKFISGARCTIKINGRIAVFATGVSWRVSTDQDEIFTIDSTTAWEMAPKRIQVDGTISGFHIPGWTPSAQNFQADVLSFMFHKYLTIEVRDRVSDTMMFVTNKAVITDWSEQVNTENLATMTLKWKAIGWISELPSVSVADWTGGIGGLSYPKGITPPE